MKLSYAGLAAFVGEKGHFLKAILHRRCYISNGTKRGSRRKASIVLILKLRIGASGDMLV